MIGNCQSLPPLAVAPGHHITVNKKKKQYGGIYWLLKAQEDFLGIGPVQKFCATLNGAQQSVPSYVDEIRKKSDMN